MHSGGQMSGKHVINIYSIQSVTVYCKAYGSHYSLQMRLLNCYPELECVYIMTFANILYV